MCGWQVKLCDPLVTHGPYLSALEIRVGIIKRYRNWSVYCLRRVKHAIISLLFAGQSFSDCGCMYVGTIRDWKIIVPFVNTMFRSNDIRALFAMSS